MALTEIQLELAADHLELWSEAMLAAGAVSVAIEDADVDTEGETAAYGEPGLPPPELGWRNNRVSVLLDDTIDIGGLLESVSRSLGHGTPAILHRRPVEDRDWVRQTQSQFAPISIGRIWIVPSWHEPPDPSACNVRIDPGIAFGTGTHPTTRLCLAWLDEHLAPGSSVLDYGCGSGILSICAAVLGAADVLGVDIDPQALATARSNAERNGARAQYTSPEGLAVDRSRQFDLVLANILANPIVLLAPTLTRHVRPGGSIVLSGILERQAGAVMDAYRRTDPSLQLSVFGKDEGWVAIVGARGI
ncbi:methylase for 50S ribosomal subunit protein L11 [Burkholderiales bacterium]|jgi:ribosomal protein L11 methyltransferase|nr:methylase for 50S ribosomal subunit protein L11 [Burkholderiales bacterium]